MSQENVELINRGHDAFNRRDFDAFLALHDPAVEFLPYEVSVQGGDPYRGHDGVRSWWRSSLEVLPDLRVESYEVRDLGDRVFVRGRLSGQGAKSGAAFERALWQTLECRDGKIVWWRAFESEAEALAAVGLAE
ncbi:MAG: nuclear transport factor 2 family protein [Solirubrobacteraceae bacterium]